MLVCQYWLASPPLALRTATTVKFLLKQGRYCKQTFDGSFSSAHSGGQQIVHNESLRSEKLVQACTSLLHKAVFIFLPRETLMQ